MNYLYLIKQLFLYEKYLKYRHHIKVEKDQKEIYYLFKALDQLMEKFQKDISFEDYALWVQVNLGNDYAQYIQLLKETNTDETILEASLNEIKTRSVLYELASAALAGSEGKKTVEDILQLVEQLTQEKESPNESPFVSTSLSELYDDAYKHQGLRWRLGSLNSSLGSLRGGDFGFIFARPESFSRDTEVLTPKGWLAVDKVTTDTYISQVNKDLTTTFVQPKAVHPHEQTHCYHIHDELGRVDLIVTEGHGMIYEKDGKLWKERADTVKYYQGKKHHVSAATSLIENVAFLPEHQLAIAYQADGHTRNYKEYGYTFSFKKKRKQQRLENILDACGFEYSKYKDGNRGHSGYYVKSKLRLHKNFDWINLSLVSQVWCQQFIEELSYWDATRRTETRFKFDTTNKNVADKVQAIAILAGYNCLLSVCIDDRSPNYSDIYSLTIRTKYQPVDGQCIIKERIPFKDTTYCFEVPSGMLLVRRNGAVAVSGNTGKTTFLADQSTYFTEQLRDDSGPGLWFNNEEQHKKVMLRCIQAALGISMQEIAKDIRGYEEQYKRITHDKLKLPNMDTTHKREMEAICKDVKPSFIIIDQVSKVRGFNNDREDLRLGAAFEWARDLAKEFDCPVIGVNQADGSGEGKKYLDMSNVANSKTAVQAEADFILGIGKSNDAGFELIRHFNISKNKLAGDETSDPNKRHAKWDALIQPDIARFRDL